MQWQMRQKVKWRYLLHILFVGVVARWWYFLSDFVFVLVDLRIRFVLRK